MKICILNVLHEADDKRVFHKVARSLADAGHAVVSICPSATPLDEYRHGIHLKSIPAAASLPQRLVSVFRLVRLGRIEQADAYLAPEPESWVAALAIKLTRRCRVVFDMHEHVPTEFAKFFPAPMRPIMTWLTVRFMRLFARATDLVILTRNSFEAPWAGLGVPRVTVINTNHLQPPCEEIPERLRTEYGGRPTLIHQGQFGEARGSYQLLEAVRLLVPDYPDLRCMVLGPYVSGSEAAYRDAVHAAGLSAHIHMLGTVPFEAVPAHIAVARIGLILFQPGPLNHTLAMPHKLFDYMRERVPVVAPAFAIEVALIVREADCGVLVDVTNPAAIAAAIRRLLEDPEEARRLGENGRRIIEEKYNWQQEERRLTEAIAQLERG